MKQRINTYLDRLPHAPIWQIPFHIAVLIPLFVVSFIINQINSLRSNKQMTTLAFRISSALKRKDKRKKNSDWARIEEPETLLRGVFLTLVVLILTGLFGALASNLLASPNDAMLRFASFLKSYGSDFDKIYASFSVALLALINLVLLVIFLVFGHSDEDDVVEMIADLDAAFNERLAETEHTLGDKLDDVYIQLGDILNGNGSNALDEEVVEEKKWDLR